MADDAVDAAAQITIPAGMAAPSTAIAPSFAGRGPVVGKWGTESVQGHDAA